MKYQEGQDLHKKLKRLLKNQSLYNWSVLDIGSGGKANAEYMRSKDANVITLDLNPATKPDVCMNVMDYNWPDEKFDLVVCLNVMQFLTDEDKVKLWNNIKEHSYRYVVETFSCDFSKNMPNVYRYFVFEFKPHFHWHKLDLWTNL